MNRSHSLRQIFFGLLLAAASLCATVAQQPASADSAVLEQGKFKLHKFEQAIGEETYEIRRDGNAIAVKMDFKFTDRGSPVSKSRDTRRALSLLTRR